MDKIELYILAKCEMREEEMKLSKILIINKGSPHTDDSSFIT